MSEGNAALVDRVAKCRCGAVSARCAGEPLWVSVCHCLSCQRRSGSAFAVQARFPAEAVTITGDTHEFDIVGDEGGRARFRFCPGCGVTIAYVAEAMPDLVAIPVGTFADPDFPAPDRTVYESRAHGWVSIGGADVVHYD